MRELIEDLWPELAHKLPPDHDHLPRGKYIGRRFGPPVKEEAEHFYQCEACGGWIDRCDLGQVFEHEGPLSASTARQTANDAVPPAI
jgi:hypothetical protein